ncbi:C4-dicarboxylate transport sensor protein DctB [Hartmannibacter diazotrophicus]|uniref:C4-dicarboxylate transport sensor protein DctB n=1 Tax=Hartmannibacter diazotrophicus TaxID=1482074 RepID=A0A2C9D7A2_9HYPH|nr:ATP-binding protein [Hartmannibacter diazotrophicus]SON55631.1 C4-dicarboxylate transport sensor protein DctB [Hartmannibacter diazotrophicus]
MRLKMPLNTIVFTVAAMLVIAGTAAVCAIVWRNGELASLRETGEHRLTFATSQLQNEISRQDYIHHIIALDPDVKDVLAASPARPGSYPIHRKLAMIGAEANTAAIYVLSRNGTVIAASDDSSPVSVIGTSHLARPYFLGALTDGSSAFFGIDPAAGRTSYFLAEAVRDGETILGVTVVKIDFTAIEGTWEAAEEKIVVTDENGVILLSGIPAWRYRTLAPLPSPTKAEIIYSDRYLGEKLDPLAVTKNDKIGRDRMISVDYAGGVSTYLMQSTQMFEHGLTVHRLVDTTSLIATERDGGIIGATLASLLLTLILYLRQRQRALSIARQSQAELRSAVAERTRELQVANATLQSEFDDHRRTERELRRIQSELLQASKMAALGQTSAALAHEINQPLGAIATYAASARLLDERGERAAVQTNLDAISGLVDRIARITRNLKRFARKSQDDPAVVFRLREAVERVLVLVGPQARGAGITVDTQFGADALICAPPVPVEQVILNLLQNAMDALADTPAPRIDVDITEIDGQAILSVVDNGPGLDGEALERLFEPFFTTKPAGIGLGLGLSISHGIVESLGGRLAADNYPGRGARLVLSLPLHDNSIGHREALAIA